jgi:plastocyanin
LTNATITLLPLLLVLPGSLFGASVTGRVRITNSNDSRVTQKGDYAGVAIWLSTLGGEALHPPLKHAVMLQKNKMFIPHVLTIGAGTIVDFPNADPIFHNAFSNFNGQIFDVSLYPPGSTRSVRFHRPGIVRVFCNIHPSMSAVIVVVDSPFFMTSAHDGLFSFSEVPPGSYQLHFFHERATAETLANLTRSVRVSAKIDAGEIEISETGYLPAPHKNKYGNDYPPHSGEAQSYSIPK